MYFYGNNFSKGTEGKNAFEKIKENPQACERLMETFYDALGVGDDYEGNGLSAEQFATALFRSYEEKGSDGVSDGNLPEQYV